MASLFNLWLQSLHSSRGREPERQTFVSYQGEDAYVEEGEEVPVIDSWPVGSIFIAVVATSPATLLGGGTWEAFGTGRMLVGLDSGDTDFDTVEETGGAKTVMLTANEMPAHTHTQDAHTHTQDAHGHTNVTDGGTVVNNGAGTALATVNASGATGTYVSPNTTAANQNATATNQNTGGGAAHANLPPYIVCYFWKRTA